MRCLSKMPPWRAPGSILEAPGLDFGGSGPRFWRLQASIFEPPGQHAPEKLFFRKFPALSAFPPPFLPSPTAWQSSNIPTCQFHGHNPITQNSCTNSVRKPKCSQNVPKCKSFISPYAFCNLVPHMQALKAWKSPNIPADKWGGGGGPPLGGVQWNWPQKW